jgi:hypothetical protein
MDIAEMKVNKEASNASVIRKKREDYREEILDEHTPIEPGAIQKTRNGRD